MSCTQRCRHRPRLAARMWSQRPPTSCTEDNPRLSFHLSVRRSGRACTLQRWLNPPPWLGSTWREYWPNLVNTSAFGRTRPDLAETTPNLAAASPGLVQTRPNLVERHPRTGLDQLDREGCKIGTITKICTVLGNDRESLPLRGHRPPHHCGRAGREVAGNANRGRLGNPGPGLTPEAISPHFSTSSYNFCLRQGTRPTPQIPRLCTGVRLLIASHSCPCGPVTRSHTRHE